MRNPIIVIPMWCLTCLLFLGLGAFAGKNYQRYEVTREIIVQLPEPLETTSDSDIAVDVSLDTNADHVQLPVQGVIMPNTRIYKMCPNGDIDKTNNFFCRVAECMIVEDLDEYYRVRTVSYGLLGRSWFNFYVVRKSKVMFVPAIQ